MDTRGPLALSTCRNVRRWAVLLGLLLGALAMLALGRPERADAAPTCTRYWTGATSTAWGTASNWSNTDGGAGSSVPDGTDFACMSTAPTRTTLVVSDARSVAGFSFPEAGSVNPVLHVQGFGTLQVGTSAVDSYASTVKTLTLQSNSTFGGLADVTAGTIGALGGVTLGGGDGSLTLASGGAASLASGTNLTLGDGYEFVNSGSVNDVNGQITLNNGTVTNHGTWTFRNNTVQALFNPGTSATHSFTNAGDGTVNVTLPAAGDTMLLQYLPIINNGGLNVTKGHLSTQVGGVGTGTYNLATGTSLELDGGVFDVTGATFAGVGAVNLNGGGAIGGTGSVRNLTANGGGLVGGGTITLPTTTTTTITSAGVYLNDGTALVNNGAVTQNNGTVAFNEGTVTNHGTWTFKNNTVQALLNPGASATHSFTNAGDGTVNVTLPAAGDTMLLQYLPIINHGGLNVTQGHLSTQVGGVGTGTYNLATGTSLELDGGVFDITGATITSAGTGALNLNGGGQLTGSPATGNLTFNGGGLVGGGTITLPTTTTTTITSAGVYLNDGTALVNNGAVTQNNGTVAFNEGTVTNHGTWTFKNNTVQALLNPGASATHSFTNAGDGTVNVTLPAAGDTMLLQYLPIINNGGLNVTKGHLSTQVGGVGTGTYNLATGTSLELDGGVFDITGATITSAGTGALNLNGGGQLTGSPATGNLTFNGGGLVGGGTITLPTTTTTTITSAGVYLNDGTALVNNGAVTQNNGTVAFNEGTVTNHGTWTFKNNTVQALLNPGASATHSFTNAGDGTVNVTLPAAGDTMLLQYLPIINNGGLNVTKGHLEHPGGRCRHRHLQPGHRHQPGARRRCLRHHRRHRRRRRRPQPQLRRADHRDRHRDQRDVQRGNHRRGRHADARHRWHLEHPDRAVALPHQHQQAAQPGDADPGRGDLPLRRPDPAERRHLGPDHAERVGHVDPGRGCQGPDAERRQRPDHDRSRRRERTGPRPDPAHQPRRGAGAQRHRRHLADQPHRGWEPPERHPHRAGRHPGAEREPGDQQRHRHRGDRRHQPDLNRDERAAVAAHQQRHPDAVPVGERDRTGHQHRAPCG